MTAVDDLALRARELLADADGGTLHIHGVGQLGPDGLDVLFYDADGRPSFLCAPNSPVAVSATRQRRAVLVIDPSPAAGAIGTLVLAGVLRVDGTETVPNGEGTGGTVSDERVLVVGLHLHSVHVEQDDPSLSPVAHRSIALDAWAHAVPDPVARAAFRIVEHTNTAHAAELRAFVAGLRAIDERDVLAAELLDLDVTGVGLRWLDDRGAHTTRLRFASPARCPHSLAELLRRTLNTRSC